MKKNSAPTSIPHNVEAEKGLLGSLLIDAEKVMPHLAYLGFSPEHFFFRTHSVLFESIRAMHAMGHPVDMVTVTTRLRQDDALDSIGGVSFLSSLIDSTPTSAHAEHYAELVKNVWQRRRVIAAADEMADSAGGDIEKTPDMIIQEGIHGLSSIIIGDNLEKRTPGQIAMEEIELWREIHHGRRKMAGLSSGLLGIDYLLGGLKKKHMILLAARPSAGKTSLAMTIARELCEVVAADPADPSAGFKKIYGQDAGIVCMDTDRTQLIQRLLAYGAGVSLSKLNFGYARNEQFDNLEAEAQVIDSLPFHYLDHTRDWWEIVSWARALKSKDKLKLLIIDYIQQITVKGLKFFGDTERVTWVSGAVKALLKELDVPGLILSQLNRDIEKAEAARKPKASDMRDSGGIEQDADTIIMLWQAPADVWLPSGPEESNTRAVLAELVKQKNGPIGTIPFYFDAPYFKFRDVPRITKHPTLGYTLDERNDAHRQLISDYWVRYNRPPPAEKDQTSRPMTRKNG